MEIGATIDSFDPNSAALSSAAAASEKSAIEALIYDRSDIRKLDTAAPPASPTSGAASGPFRLSEWVAGKHAILVANDEYPGGRPFLDAIDIQMGRSAKDMLLDLELNKTDLAEIPAEEARRAAEQGVRVSGSPPEQLIALVFASGASAPSGTSGRPAADDARVREAISRAVDRPSIVNFILQKQGDPAGGLLPQWLSGAAFLFPTAPDPAGAKERWSTIPGSPKIVLGYDAADGLQQAVAERIVVNAREAGISLALTALPNSAPTQATGDARLVRVEIASPRPRQALAGMLEQLAPFTAIDAAPLPEPASPSQIYEREQAIVSTYRIVPIAWIPRVYGLSARVRDWKAPGPGENWPLADVWLDGTAATAASPGGK